MVNKIIKGVEREKELEKKEYYTDAYFSMAQLCSLSHQINEIYHLKPKSILEIGIGNGFVSDFLKKSGMPVCTVDINPNLSPDIVSSIEDLPEHLDNSRFDLVVCCEVLEHMPFEEFVKSISIFKRYSKRLFLTLPKYKCWYGISGFLTKPLFNELFSLGIYLRSKKDMSENHCHFWELDSCKETSIKNIRNILEIHYDNVSNHSLKLCKYHECFICE